MFSLQLFLPICSNSTIYGHSSGALLWHLCCRSCAPTPLRLAHRFPSLGGWVSSPVWGPVGHPPLGGGRIAAGGRAVFVAALQVGLRPFQCSLPVRFHSSTKVQKQSKCFFQSPLPSPVRARAACSCDFFPSPVRFQGSIASVCSTVVALGASPCSSQIGCASGGLSCKPTKYKSFVQVGQFTFSRPARGLFPVGSGRSGFTPGTLPLSFSS